MGKAVSRKQGVRTLLALGVLIAVTSLSSVHAIRFMLDRGTERCFTETFSDHSTVMGEYLVATGKGHMSVDLEIMDDSGGVIFTKKDVDHGKFEFQTHSRRDGRGHRGHMRDPDDNPYMDDFYYYDDEELWAAPKYRLCVKSPEAEDADDKAASRRVSLKILTGSVAKDYDSLAKEEHLSELEVTLRAMNDEVSDLVKDLEHVRSREDSLRAINEKTSKLVVTFSVVSCLVMLVVGAYQVFFMKNYLKARKLL
ncbi:Transmembrane protein Tmp21 [Porphyridium purpureum]|uniref:Transmembrane protein Tmp21 n=1 Tax=Porphyridium purpureum TaxID=35688 RepID=A0A5J4Z3Y7_PORPP|nr:Transmembrane protein Tmp21 [Porphyridium purpureum]|eukprot:POR4965..scf295_1